MLDLLTLGTLDLRAPDGTSLQSVLSQPRRAALLVYLAAARPRGPRRRDAIVALFWPEAKEASARHALSQALYGLRRCMGLETVQTEGNEVVELQEGAIRCDVEVFDRATEEHRWSDALCLYAGEFLYDFHVSNAWAFEQWADTERKRLRTAAADAAWALAREQLGRDMVTEAKRSGLKAVMLDPTDESRVRALIQALATAGDRAAAMDLYQRWSTALEGDLGLSPSPRTSDFVEALRRN